MQSHDEKPKLTEDLIRRYFEVGQNLKGEDVVNTLNHIAAERGLPLPIRSNGSEFISKIMDKWAYEPASRSTSAVRASRPTNAKVESFNGCLRQECLNLHWFLSLEDARCKIDEWRQYYNEMRPHSASRWATPAKFSRPGKGKCLARQAYGAGNFHF